MSISSSNSLHCISLMSGTSADGIDAVLVDFTLSTDNPTCQVQAAIHSPLSAAYQTQAVDVIAQQNLQAAFTLGQLLAQEYADVVGRMLDEQGLDKTQIAFVAVSGHTLFHQSPTEKHNGLTIDTTDLSMLSAMTGITVIGRFRQKDIALGGQGAPLVPFAHQYLFGPRQPDCIVQNIGGIGNLTVLEGGIAQAGFDTGPGNTWMDQTIKWHTNSLESFDQEGRNAAKGQVDQGLADEILFHPFFRQAPPKSTGIKTIGYPHLTGFKSRLLQHSIEDALATVTFATAKSIADSYQDWVWSTYNPTQVIVCGGGAYNLTLLKMLREQLPTAEIATSTDYDIVPTQVEAICFAYLGLFRYLGKPNVLAKITGSLRDNIGGEIAHAG